MADPSSMLCIIWESKDRIYHQRWHLVSFHPSAFKRQAWSSRQGGEVILPKGREWQSREVKPRGAIRLEIFVPLDRSFSLFGASYALIFPVVLFTYL